MFRLNDFLWRWLPWAAMSVILPGLVYAAVQQDIRQSANDPQIEMAEDASVQLNEGSAPQSVASGPMVNVAKSLKPFLIVYDQGGRVLASTGQLNGKTPDLPNTTLPNFNTGQHQIVNSALNSRELRFTWQPQLGVRLATVVTQFGGPHPGFVLAARNMREVEAREQNLFQLSALASLVLLLTTAAGVMVWPRH